uniref:(northern house mosquito) hypothetical protein n=1 Tax=Culex pipiens TaxID=7175 RepID=A0A8D8L7E7_CULPI
MGGFGERSPLLQRPGTQDPGRLRRHSGRTRGLALPVCELGWTDRVRIVGLGFRGGVELMLGLFRRPPSLARSPLSRQGRSDSRERGLSLGIRAVLAREIAP